MDVRGWQGRSNLQGMYIFVIYFSCGPSIIHVLIADDGNTEVNGSKKIRSRHGGRILTTVDRPVIRYTMFRYRHKYSSFSTVISSEPSSLCISDDRNDILMKEATYTGLGHISHTFYRENDYLGLVRMLYIEARQPVKDPA